MGKQILFDKIKVPGIKTYEVYRREGGYASVEKALKTMTPDEVVTEVKNSQLKGRGGAGFPMGMKWSFIDKKSGNPRYLVCNADESEPGTFKDRFLMEYIPHLLIEGMITGSYALEANRSYIYIRGEYMWIYKILENAIKEAYAAGWLGKNILGTGYDLDLYVHVGAGAYICGEETALIESLEGKRGNPRIKPPFPAISGLWANPTVVNNVESISNVPWIVNNSGAEYAKIGTEKSTGTKLISASGHIKKPGVYEIELGITVYDFINSDEYCGGMLDEHPIKALVPGGSSVPILPAHLIYKTANGDDRLMSYESMSDGGFATGSMIGSGGFIVYNDTTCIVRNTWNFARFYHHESCGQCSPCREGTGWLEKVLHRIETGHGREEDIDLLWDIQRKIEGNTICPLGDAAAWPVAAAIRHFRDEFEYHVRFPEKIKNRDHYVAEPFEKVKHLVSGQLT
ncbi:NADH-quinone oxidoreductase subunit F [Flavobacterium noncentrifugens]|uniref:NADH-quinone oxidoreductase subunit F n=1 Tax=Flavobacterium noncentrifugens TaxID=1128970 RepID=A0A1G9AK23_9FLAO|nr:NADH-quinone oxidoreductase subunit NuoF [Flavobacterium noncentrifugens]GEP51456.1 NADH-quinone oxidoreductase subunit F [Flavobacterium noncentrifugens]SDK26930.1 NADH dehydrogenase subunit F [Flavobacterium noncentrifugens]